ncbi:MAG: ParA family protein [Actinomycetota bacterium]|nr:MAG: ParA family protein [Actinomycetota bacterium]
MPIVAVTSLKGGVGKSTITLGLAGAAWELGLRVLVVDLDPQANSTATLDPVDARLSVGDVLADARPGIAADAIVASGWGRGVELLASEQALEHRNARETHGSSHRLRVALDGVADRYDVVLVDCPPSLGELTRNGLAAAQRALIVTEPGFFALQGAAQALEAVAVVRDTTNLALRAAGIVVNRLRPSLREHVFRLDELRRTYGGLVLDPPVLERAAVAQAQGACVPVQAWRSPGIGEVIDAFDDLLDELLAPADHAGPALAGGVRPLGSPSLGSPSVGSPSLGAQSLGTRVVGGGSVDAVAVGGRSS